MLQNNQKVIVKNIEEIGTVVGYIGEGTYIILWDTQPTDSTHSKIDKNHWRARAVYVSEIYTV